jgi:OOP family OmpA-OmpF porin
MPSLTRTLPQPCWPWPPWQPPRARKPKSSSHVQRHLRSSNYSFYAPGSRYFGLNIGQSDFSLPNGTGGFPSDNKDTSYNIYGGSYFNNNFGLELGYTDFGKANRAGGQTEAQGINLSLVGRLPLSNSFNLLGKLGTTYGHTRVSPRRPRASPRAPKAVGACLTA